MLVMDSLKSTAAALPEAAGPAMELVCPAGSLPALKAAVDHGANCVYVGLRDATNARNFAGLNFDEAAIAQGIDHAHARGCKVFMALNTYPQAANPGPWRSALDKAVESINEELKKVGGVITSAEYEINLGVSGASVNITLAINGSEPRKKEVVGVNVRGYSREQSVKKAANLINSFLENKRGEIVSVYTKTIDTPLPGRVYTTMIVAINGYELEEVRDAEIRRERIKRALELLNNDPSVINVARVAEVFGVSRTIIYRDLEALGFKRTSGEENQK